MNWHFLPNQSNEVDGPNDAGITHFAGRVHGNVIRESIQNALDVPADPTRAHPVRVEFRLGTVKLDAIGAPDLIQHLEMCVSDDSDNNEETRKQMRRGLDCLLNPTDRTIPCLWITDSRTTGAQGKQWKALTKGSGYTEKTIAADAGGSYGLGKFAPFAATPLRSVFYSTLFTRGQSRRSRTSHQQFIGKALLVSHRDSQQTNWRSTGYLCHEGFAEFVDDEVPPEFRLDAPGTRICIPAYPLDIDADAWEQSSVVHVLQHFFVALLQGKLEVQVNDQILNRNSMDRSRSLLEAYKKRAPSGDEIGEVDFGQILRLLDAAKQDPIATRSFENVGTVNVRLQVYEKASSGGRDIDMALVRDIGMVILNRRTDFRKGFWPGKAVGHSWTGFTLLVEVLATPNGPNWLRDIETPAHDDISYDLIQDASLRKQARRALRSMGAWIWRLLEEQCAPQESQEEELPVTIFDALFQGPNQDSDKSGESSVDWEKSDKALVVEQSTTHRQVSLFDPHSRRWVRRRDDDGDDDDSNSSKRKKSKTGKRRRSKPKRVSAREEEMKHLRLREMGQETHCLSATFDTPDFPLHRVGLRKVTEDGQAVPVRVRSASLGEIELTVGDDGRVDIETWPDQDRVQLVFRTLEPVAGKSFCLVPER